MLEVRRATQTLGFAAALASAASCDQGEPTDVRESVQPLRLVAASVSRDRPVTSDGEIDLVFNRLLLPVTVTRQSIAVADAFDAVGFPVMRYDPLRRRVTLANPEPSGAAWLTAGQPYRVILGVPKGDEILGGLRALDGATIDPKTPRLVGFYVTAPLPAKAPERVSYCREVAPLLHDKCGSCHEGTSAAAGLDLSSERLAATAFGRVARASMRGPSVTQASLPDRHFGADMAIIDPGSPGTSYLVYKLLLDPSDGKPMYTPCGSVAARAAWSISSEERTLLRERILGHGQPAVALTEDETATVSQWIAEGADVPECSGCDVK